MHRTNVVSSSLGYIAFLLLIYSISTSHWATWSLVDNDWNADAGKATHAPLFALTPSYVYTVRDLGVCMRARVHALPACPGLARAAAVHAWVYMYIDIAMLHVAPHLMLSKPAVATAFVAEAWLIYIRYAVSL